MKAKRKQPNKQRKNSKRSKKEAELAPIVASSDRFNNRELSLLKFIERVLDMAADPEVPLLDRLRFLTISVSIMDEFFEIRVARLKQHIALDIGLSSAYQGESARALLRKITRVAHRIVDKQYKMLNEQMLPALAVEGIRVLKRVDWTESQARWIAEYFDRAVLPVLTPVGLDPAHPFPRIANKSLNFAVTLEGEDAFERDSRTAIVQAPRVLPRLVRLPARISEQPDDFVMLSSVIHEHVAALFPGMEIRGCYQFRVTRDSELWVDEEEVDDLLHALKGELLSRRYGGACRLEVADNCSAEMAQFLLDQFDLQRADLYTVEGPVNLHRLSALYDLVDRPPLKFPSFIPGHPTRLVSEANIFEAIGAGDILLHHPFQSFAPVVELVRQAARDPQVLAIKQTVYRAGQASPLAEALIEAARMGKEVTAVIELRARFDEAANIALATRLQEAGATVVYGIVGYKTHAKMMLVIRQEGDQLRRYVHLGTGNYHIGTTRAYTDFGLLSANPRLGADVHGVFQQLTGLGSVCDLDHLLLAPFTLFDRMMAYIGEEIAEAQAGRPARIIAKMNALIEPRIISALYEASQAGVQVDLIVRGICCLRPGVPGLSEHIRVRSVLGRFLEHSRVYYFHAAGRERLYLASADWMPRNFFRRIEVAFPVEDARLKARVIVEALELNLDAKARTWELANDGRYRRKASPAMVHPQEQMLQRLAEDYAASGS